MQRPISEQVVVITGASSGIGRCTALYLARRGARVVVTARRADALASLVREIEAEGGRALAVPGDVTREEDLRAVARAALERWGRIDSWINNAGIYIQGRVQDITLDEFRRVLDVNLVGLVNGTRCALEPMLRQGSGVVVQVSSVAAKRGVPYNSAYSAAKAGIEAFTESLRAELWGTGVRFSILYPPPVDTPIYQHARAKLGVQPKPAPPMSYPVEAAREIARLAETGERERYFGWAGLLALLHRLSPAASDWLTQHGAAATWADLPPDSVDNLDRPADFPPTVGGGWAEPGWRGVTLRQAARIFPWETVLGAVAAGFVAGRVSRRIGGG